LFGLYYVNFGLYTACFCTNVPVNVLIKVPVNKTEQKVLDFIFKNPEATYDEIAQGISKTPKTVQRCLNNLKKNGVIHRVGADKNGFWVVNKPE